MGQRLVVTIHNNEKELCAIYFHWSAYSFSALLETQKILNCIYNSEDETESELLLRLIRFCEENGGGIRAQDDEFAYIEALYPNETFKKDDYSRNYGLIALSEKGIQDLQSWSEGDIDIYIDEDKICNGVYSYYESIDDYNTEHSEWDEDFEPVTLEDITDIGYDLGEISIYDIDDVIDELRNVDWVCRNGNEIFELTE